jgi:aspartate aminotransferase-like enzyme/GNAT superfamily N-acetyltransferase
MNRTPASHADEPLTFKVATDHGELEQIHRLNYRTFVEEIPQHAPNERGELVDRFDRENAYVVCRRGERVLGMIAVRGVRPFSLDAKIDDLDAHLPPNRRICEIRLLAVEPEHRTGVIFRGLVTELMAYCLRAGFDTVVISGTTRQLKLYRHLGFVAFGPMVGSGDAPYQPMYLTREAFEPRAVAFLRPEAASALVAAPRRQPIESFLPGPVTLHDDVWRAFTEKPVSHRHPAFAADLRAAKDALCRLTGAPRIEILVGSGSLANDVVAAQLSLLEMPGLVLSNGEFGERLADHAARTGLVHGVLRAEWGFGFDRATLVSALDEIPAGGWCWLVHCETSTGVLNDLGEIAVLCAERSIRLCADCISSIGTVPVSLDGVYLASCVSGKALGGLPGLSIIFHHHPVAPSTRIPRYLDLGLYAQLDGVPFTHSSNLLAALRVASEHALRRAPFVEMTSLAKWLRDELRAIGYPLVAPDAVASPSIVTLAPPDGVSAEALGERLAAAGFELSFRSGYLRRRNWIQISTMGECSRERLEALLSALRTGQHRPGLRADETRMSTDREVPRRVSAS